MRCRTPPRFTGCARTPRPTATALARRATNDFGAILDALWGLGYYNATAQISIDGAASTIVSPNIAAFGRAADSYRNRAAAPVTIRVDPGPLFHLREIQVVNGAGESLFRRRAAAARDRPQARRPGGGDRAARG